MPFLIPLLTLALLEEEEQERRRRISRLRRVIRPKRINAFSLPDNEFIRRFRLSKPLALQLIETLRPALQPRTFRRDAFQVEIKVLTALRFFATGNHQKDVSNDSSIMVSQQSASNMIRQVADAINVLMLRTWISFPSEQQELDNIKADFLSYSNFPGVIGAIGCTHVSIVTPSAEHTKCEWAYFNEKEFYSINVQLVCDTHLKITNVNAKFPGSSEDWYIWLSSNLKSWLDLKSDQLKECWLLGHSGYPLEKYLLTPFDSPTSEAQVKYNSALEKSRTVIEKTNQLLKSRFRCLRKDRPLNYAPAVAGQILNSCAVLHNMCADANILPYELLSEDLEADDMLFLTGRYHRDKEEEEEMSLEEGEHICLNEPQNVPDSTSEPKDQIADVEDSDMDYEPEPATVLLRDKVAAIISSKESLQK